MTERKHCNKDPYTGDPFYAPENMARLRRAVRRLEAGKGTEHELIEAELEEKEQEEKSN